jgi:predicted acyl esterase
MRAGAAGTLPRLVWVAAVTLGMAACLTSLAPIAKASGPASVVTRDLAFAADDGVVLHATMGGAGGVSRRPLIIEDTPYGTGCCNAFAGPAYNYIVLQWRGTGQSYGSFSSTGLRDQKDLSEFVSWACGQPWSDGNIGLYGFSASAIIAYDTMHLPLPCVKAAAMMSGTIDLYRDLLYIGGVNNTVPGLVVEAGIGGGFLGSLPGRVHGHPASVPDSVLAYLTTPFDVRSHSTEDAYWTDRTFQGNPAHIPILADDGFYDVESRGAFQTYLANRQYGSHLLVIGAHDGFAGGTPGPFPQYARWFDHYVRGIANGVDTEPAVSLYLSSGSHKELLDGHFTHLSGTGWPLPGTQWIRLYLSPSVSGTAHSINDGTLSTAPGRAPTVQSYPFVPSDPAATDLHTMSTISGSGAGGLTLDNGAKLVPALTDMQLPEPTSLSYTTAPFATAVDAVGPASLDVFASSTAGVTDLVAVLADVWPDGSAHPVATGQLRTAFPGIDKARSTIDPPTGDIVDPYADFSTVVPPAIGAVREYHLEILPVGNHFSAGHRLRLYLVGTSATMLGATPGVNSISIGGVTPSRLIFPTVGAGQVTASAASSARAVSAPPVSWRSRF